MESVKKWGNDTKKRDTKLEMTQNSLTFLKLQKLII